MRFAVLLLLTTTCSFAQGPSVSSVVGAADFSDGTAIGIPLGSIFTIKGSGLASSIASASALNLPTVLNGVSVGIWDAATEGKLLGLCPLWFVSPFQVNAILPSLPDVGTYYVAVDVFGLRPPRVAFLVTKARFAAFSQGGRGFGPTAAQQYDPGGRGPFLNQFTVAASPGSILVLWGTGLGGGIRSDITVYIDGAAAAPVYAGPAPGLPGIDQINFVLPAGAKPRCFVPLQVATGGVSSEVSTISVGAEGSCSSEFGLSPSALARLDRGGVVTAAVLRLASTSQTSGALVQSAEAWFAEYDSANLSQLALEGQSAPVKGAPVCTRNQVARYYGATPTANRLPHIDLSPVIFGASGCSWGSASDQTAFWTQLFPPSACTAASFRFFNTQFEAVGTFPPPRASGAIAAFHTRQDAGGLVASWTVLPLPSDKATLTISSSHSSAVMFGSPRTEHADLSCTAQVLDSPFAVSPRDLAWAWQYSYREPATLALSTVADQVFPARPPFDFVLVRAVNVVQASSSPTP